MSMTSRIFRVLVVALVSIGATLASAQQALTPVRSKGEQKKAVAYRITTGDEISVQIANEPDLSAVRRRVDASGKVVLQYIDPVSVYGLTLPEAADAIERAYKDGRILRKPEVTVNVEVYARRTVNVTGEVKLPSQVELPPEEQWTIKDVIVKVGGFTDTAKGTEVRLTRRGPDGKDQFFVLDVQSSILGKKSAKSEDASFVVEPGDSIHVPQRMI